MELRYRHFQAVQVPTCIHGTMVLTLSATTGTHMHSWYNGSYTFRQYRYPHVFMVQWFWHFLPLQVPTRIYGTMVLTLSAITGTYTHSWYNGSDTFSHYRYPDAFMVQWFWHFQPLQVPTRIHGTMVLTLSVITGTYTYSWYNGSDTFSHYRYPHAIMVLRCWHFQPLQVPTCNHGTKVLTLSGITCSWGRWKLFFMGYFIIYEDLFFAIR